MNQEQFIFINIDLVCVKVYASKNEGDKVSSFFSLLWKKTVADSVSTIKAKIAQNAGRLTTTSILLKLSYTISMNAEQYKDDKY